MDSKWVLSCDSRQMQFRMIAVGEPAEHGVDLGRHVTRQHAFDQLPALWAWSRTCLARRSPAMLAHSPGPGVRLA